VVLPMVDSRVRELEVMVDTIGLVVYGAGETWVEPAIMLDSLPSGAVLVTFEKGVPGDSARPPEHIELPTA